MIPIVTIGHLYTTINLHYYCIFISTYSLLSIDEEEILSDDCLNLLMNQKIQHNYQLVTMTTADL